MKVWLDDIRLKPEFYDVWVKTPEEAINLLKTNSVTHISLDHDLGEDIPTGYEVALFIESSAYDKSLSKLEWRVHSANPVGVVKMTTALQNADKYWNQP